MIPLTLQRSEYCAQMNLSSIRSLSCLENEANRCAHIHVRLIEDAQPQQANTSHKSKKQLAAIAANAAKAATDAASKAAAEAAAAIAADVIVITIPSFPEKEITLGQVRHRIADPLLKGINETLPEAMGRAVASEGLSVGERMAVWEGVAVVGEMAKFKCE